MCRDIFPAELLEVGTSTPLLKCRVQITSHRMLVWQEHDGVPDLVLEVDLAERGSVFEGRAKLAPNAHIDITTTTTGYFVNQGRGCQCGSALKALGLPAPWSKR